MTRQPPGGSVGDERVRAEEGGALYIPPSWKILARTRLPESPPHADETTGHDLLAHPPPHRRQACRNRARRVRADSTRSGVGQPRLGIPVARQRLRRALSLCGPRDWHLALDKRRDVHPVEDPLDINGWDIRKALQLLLRANPVLSEWLVSPYREDETCARRLLAARTRFGRSARYHYLPTLVLPEGIGRTRNHSSEEILLPAPSGIGVAVAAQPRGHAADGSADLDGRTRPRTSRSHRRIDRPQGETERNGRSRRRAVRRTRRSRARRGACRRRRSRAAERRQRRVSRHRRPLDMPRRRPDGSPFRRRCEPDRRRPADRVAFRRAETAKP